VGSIAAPAIEVVRGDCLDVLAGRPAAFAELAYLDPPFNTGRRHRAAAGDYPDCWPDIDAYLAYLRPRVEAVHRALTPDGAILLHCDWRACHHLRLMLDEVFGVEGFVNHLVWSYGLGGSSPKHDDILFYVRGDGYYFEPPRVPATSARMRGQTKKATDVLDVPTINNMATERVGYPTQKPCALLEMLVAACCPPGGVVLDPFMGSGTTLVAAAALGRAAVGIDVNDEAVEIARRRCREMT
jgi:DNA modification methylase